jgi:hypothetical protein
MTAFGILLGLIGTILTAFITFVIYVLDPIGFITVPLSELYAAPDHEPMYPLTAGWAIVALASVWGFAFVEARRTRSTASAGRRAWLLRIFGAVALLGGVALSSVVPGFPVGLGFITDAERGGYFTGDGSGLMTAVWMTGAIAAAAGLIGLATTHLLRAQRA